MNRVLIIESIRDDVAAKRCKNRLLCNRLIFWKSTLVYSIESEDIYWVPEHIAKSILCRAAFLGETIPLESIEKRLFFRTKGQIEAFKPDIVLLFTGFVFQRYCKQIFNALSRLHEEYPSLSFGSFGVKNTELLGSAPHGLFDNTEEIKKIEGLFLEGSLNR